MSGVFLYASRCQGCATMGWSGVGVSQEMMNSEPVQGCLTHKKTQPARCPCYVSKMLPTGGGNASAQRLSFSNELDEYKNDECSSFRGAPLSAGIAGAEYRGSSLTRKRNPVGPYRRPMPRVLGGS